MKFNPRIHHRRSIRLQGYDYSQAGACFVTICTQNRECLFGDIADGGMRLNDAGQMVQTVWDEIPAHYPGIDIDAFVVMPNHIHGIIIIVGAGPRACPGTRACPEQDQPQEDGQPRGEGQPQGDGQPRGIGHPRGGAPTGLSLPDVVHRLKTLTTKRYVDGVKQNGWLPFPGKLWQRNYWEHVVRNEPELTRIREYIQNNPIRWELDKLHPDNPVGAGPRACPGTRACPEQDQPRDGQPRDGQPRDGQPQDGQPQDGQPQEGQPQEGQPQGDGQPQGVAPTGVREPLVGYEYVMSSSHDEGWMV